MTDQVPPPADEPPSPTDQAPRRRRWPGLVLAGVVGMLVGAAIAATLLLVAGPEREPQHTYQVTVFLKRGVTSEQKAAIESKLSAVGAIGGVRFETREQAWQKYQERFKDDPEMANAVQAEHMPESFRLTTKGTWFDCRSLAPARHLPGVDQILVVQAATNSRPGAEVACG